MTVKKIIIRYLESHPVTRIANLVFETELPAFGLGVYGAQHTPGTYSRAWRDLRTKKELTKYGFSVIETHVEGSIEKHFIVRRLSEVHRDSEGKSEQTGNDNPVSGSTQISPA